MKTRSILPALTLILTLPMAANAQSWECSVSDGTATVNRETARGRSLSRSTTCANGQWGCSTDFSGTGAGGQTVEGSRSSARGPFRGRSVTSVTGPEGNTVIRPNRWRR
jgi:hypothetical protein